MPSTHRKKSLFPLAFTCESEQVFYGEPRDADGLDQGQARIVNFVALLVLNLESKERKKDAKVGQTKPNKAQFSLTTQFCYYAYEGLLPTKNLVKSLLNLTNKKSYPSGDHLSSVKSS